MKKGVFQAPMSKFMALGLHLLVDGHLEPRSAVIYGSGVQLSSKGNVWEDEYKLGWGRGQDKRRP